MTMPSGAASSSPRKSLVWRYLSWGSRMPMATSGPRSLRVGVSVRSTAVEVPLVCRSWASRTVTSMLFATTAATAIFWKACMDSRPKSSTVWPGITSWGTPTISPAALLASTTTPSGSASTMASSDVSTMSASASKSHSLLVVQHLHVSIRLDRRARGSRSPGHT